MIITLQGVAPKSIYTPKTGSTLESNVPKKIESVDSKVDSESEVLVKKHLEESKRESWKQKMSPFFRNRKIKANN